VSDALTTQVLLEKAQQGDDESLNELCRRYQARVLAAVRMRLGAELRRRVESWDIVQDVMIDALRRLNSFEYRTEGAFLHLLNRVVENKIRDEADKQHAARRTPDREIFLDGSRSPGGVSPLENLKDSATPTPSKVMSLHEDLALLEQAMDRLAAESEEYRDLIVAVKIEGLMYTEIGAQLGISADAARMKLQRAMAALTRIFQRLEADKPDSNGAN
jgi:RNA polymerase sigma-70 factor, ECF subfamily